jgi:hypothetical protein
MRAGMLARHVRNGPWERRPLVGERVPTRMSGYQPIVPGSPLKGPTTRDVIQPP